MSELKACPFCNVVSGDINEHTDECYLRWIVVGDIDIDIEVGYNTRPIEEDLCAENERLKGAMRKIAETHIEPDKWGNPLVLDAFCKTVKIAQEALG